MGTYRKQPFGYKMQWGKIVLQEQEASVVRWIYQTYLSGASYNDLVETLRKQTIPYITGKLWNKNMVARILENPKYTGESEYPPLISQEQFEAVRMRRKKQTSPPQKTPVQKELRRLCGSSPPPWVERQVLERLNHLIRHPKDLCCPQTAKNPSPDEKQLRRDLDELLKHPPVNEDRAREMALHLAELQLNAIGPEEYETTRLQRLFQKHRPMDDLDQGLLQESVRHITYNRRTVSILLKNNQIVEGGTPQ